MGQPLVYAVPAQTMPDRPHAATQHGYGPHPRSETKGMGPALQKMLVQKAETRLRKMEGTPGYPNKRLSLASASQEQVSYDHFNARERMIPTRSASLTAEPPIMPVKLR